MQLSVDEAYARAPTWAPGTSEADLHRIAPHEEVVLDAATSRARLAGTDESSIDAALIAHGLHAPEREPAPEDTAPIALEPRTGAGSDPLMIVATLAALGLAVGMAFALAGW